MGLLYDMGTDAVRADLVASLVSSLTATQAQAQAQAAVGITKSPRDFGCGGEMCADSVALVLDLRERVS